MDVAQLKNKATSAIFWNLSGTLLKQGVTFIISIFLARLLSPKDFGLVGMAMVFITLTQRFSDFGMTSGLIQRKDPSEVQYSTVFFINLCLSFILMLTMILTSSYIGEYYHNPEVAEIARFISYTFIINALNGVQTAQLTKALANKIKTLAALYSSIATGVSGLILAYNGYGVWSLVYSSLIGSIVNTVVIWNRSAWRPKALFNFQEVKPLYSFGSKIFFGGILDTAYSQLDVLIIGRAFSVNTLGYYYRAASLDQLVTKYTSGAMQGIFFPLISHLQHDRDEQLRVISKSLHIMSFLTFTLMGLLYLNAKELILILFSDKWLLSVSYFKIIIFCSYVTPISIILVNVLSGNGYSGKFLKMGVWQKIFGVSSLIIGASFFGISGFLVCMVVSATFSLLLNMWFVSRVINFSFALQIKIVYQYFLYSILAILPVVLFKNLLSDSLFLLLIIGTISFIILNSFMNKLFCTAGYVFIERKILFYIKKKVFFD